MQIEMFDHSEKLVKPERTGWRDLRLSKRHRLWGFDCPAVDLDFLLLEYDGGKAVALVEYKNHHAPPLYEGHPTYAAITDLGDRAGLPVFICQYTDGLTYFQVTPLNRIAKSVYREIVTVEHEWMTEREWVTFLYRLRGRSVPENILSGLGQGETQ